MKRRPNDTLHPEGALSAWNAAPAPSGAVVRARCTLLTPMYGGGVEPGRVDCELPVRASALRGQIRFWWRLLHGRGQPSPEAFRDESALWGGISSGGPKASLVTVQVRGEPVETDQLVRFKSRSRQKFPDYALIVEQNDDPLLLPPGYAFELTLRFDQKIQPHQRAQAIEALRWWGSFGGVGARTRRGLGAVNVMSDDTDLQPVSREEVEARGGRMAFGPVDAGGAVAAWKAAVDVLKDFRQGPDLGRNTGSRRNRPGRSRWPEPNTIRRLARRSAKGHEPEPQHPADGLYPRAAFGLPIVFHFKDSKQGDPWDHVLQPRDRDRMASPLILRPYFDGEGCRPLALLLPGWGDCVSVEVGFDSKTASSYAAWPLDPAERKEKAAHVPPMQGRGDDALSAFMHYFEYERTAGGAHKRQQPARPRSGRR